MTLVDADDAVQGDPLATLAQEEIPVAAMGTAGYNFAVPDNHEFDYGLGRLQELKEQANNEGITYLPTNVLEATTGNVLMNAGAAASWYLIDGKPVLVGFVGITTPESLNQVAPLKFPGREWQHLRGLLPERNW